MTTNCRHDGCGDAAKSAGLCPAHYMRKWRYGSPSAGGARHRNLTRGEAYDEDVIKGKACWGWSGNEVNPNGYAVIKGMLAHRFSFEREYGFLPEVVMHKCDNPICTNPGHLKGGTQADNMRDAYEKGRHGRPDPKIPDSEIANILQDARPQKEIAKQYGVDASLISMIKSGKRRSTKLTQIGMESRQP